MRFQTLPQWLQWQENLHFTEVDPGLERVGKVWESLGGAAKLPFTVITVAGTNGKGSSVAMLEAILRAAGYQTGTYTSPHLLSYNERICIDGIPVDDIAICNAFDRIDKVRDQVSLTYFEFATLAAVDIFSHQKIDIAILEVGMGGRLDAVNLFDSDIALITPISLDHTAWLGNNREQIATEKAGIIRAGKPVVCSESPPPQSVLNYAVSLNSCLYQAESDFKVDRQAQVWHWSSMDYHWYNLPFPALTGAYQIQNAAAVLQVISLLISQGFKIREEHIKTGLISVRLAGRFQQIPGDVEVILDVTHNQQGAENLVKLLLEKPSNGRTIAVIAMLKDKDISAVVSTLKDVIDFWYVAGIDGNRGMSGEQLAIEMTKLITNDRIHHFNTVVDAYQQAKRDALFGDRILVFGSFHTVEAVLRFNTINEMK